MNILVASGATREPLDAVRFISNVSTGATGAVLADAWESIGHSVTLLRGEGAAEPRRAREKEIFTTAEDLRVRLQKQLSSGKFEIAVMAAAISDYRAESVIGGKISSEPEAFSVRLVRNAKVAPLLKSYSPRPLFVVGFKLTAGAESKADRRSAVVSQFDAGGIDIVVHNDLEEIRRSPIHPFWIYRTPDGTPVPVQGAESLAIALEGLFPGRA